MSTESAASGGQTGVRNTDEVDIDQQEVESSREASESSGSQSESGEESDNSSESLSEEQSQHEVSSVDGSGDEGHGTSESDGSNTSYKSVNASMARSEAAEIATNESRSPTKSATKAVVKTAKVKPVVETGGKTPKVTMKDTESTSVGIKPESPVPVTPGKSLVVTTSPPEVAIDFNEIDINTKEQLPAVKNEPRTPRSPGECSGSDANKPEASSVSSSVDPDKQRKRSRHPSNRTIKEPRSPKLKKNKRDKVVKSREKTRTGQTKSVESVVKQVAQLQEQLEEVLKAGAGSRNRVKTNRHKSVKAAKSKKARTQSGGGDSPKSSDSDQPTSSSRIGKISSSRKLQLLAIARSKQLGALREGDIHHKEVTDALKLVDTVVFPTEPTQSYRKFFQVPGVGISHLEKHAEELQADVGDYVGLTAKLNLELAQSLLAAKKQRVNAEPDGGFLKIWQFGNDVLRTSASGDQSTTPDKAQLASSSGAGGSKSGAGEGKKSGVDQHKKNADKAKEGGTDKAKTTRKRRTTGSRAEDDV